MNERVQTLVGQAKFMAEEAINKQISKNAELDAFAGKLAELIVQECVNVLHDNELWNRHISHALKEHFGVEE